MRRLFLRDCAPGDLVDDVFVIAGKQLSASSSGKPYIKGFISDRTAQVTARLWNATRELFQQIPDGGFARILGRVENYQGNLQIIIDQIGPPREGSFEIADLLPHTSKDIPTMCRRLAELLGSIHNRHLASLVQVYLDDDALMADLCRAPAAMSFHHAYIGGLLEHTLNAIEVADAICRFYPGLNRDLVLTGIFLHDIAKTWELTYACSFGYSDGGQLVGHIVKSAIWVEHKAKEAEALLGEKIPQALIDVVQHIILSHHGQPEFGAAKVPATPEAIAVHIIENMDAKLMMALHLTRGEGASAEGKWTEYQKSFGGRLYRPDVAMLEEEFEAAPEFDRAPASPPIPAPALRENRPTPSRGPSNGNEVHPSVASAPAPAVAVANEPSATQPQAPQIAKPAPPAPGPLRITNPLFDLAALKQK